MATKRNDPKVKPMEEWGVKEWESAYSTLMQKHENLRRIMRQALQHLNKAI